MDYITAGAAAVCAGFFTNPLEMLKTRMQLQGELQRKGEHIVHYKNTLHAGYVVAKHDGILALQKGLVPALWVQFIMNGLRLGTYESLSSKGYIRDSQGDMVLYKNVLLGGCCGVLGHFCASPLHLIKTHLQSEATETIAVGFQHHHTGTWKALKKIVKNYGLKGLFRGAGAAVPRAFIASSSQLTSFTYVKEMLAKYEVLENYFYTKSFLASMASGVAISTIVAPFDLVLIRLYNQGTDVKGLGLLYTSYVDCIVKIYKSEGILGFYKGLGAMYVRLGPHTILCMMFWDLFKDIQHRYESTDNNVS